MPLKRVNKIEGHLVTRPAKDHPDLAYWFALRNLKVIDQDYQCATCWRSSEDYSMELHHRHYDNWGQERLEDVALLCVSCHDAITNTIRSRRRALGDQTLSTIISEPKPVRSKRPKTRKVKNPRAVKAKKVVKSRKPKIKKRVVPKVKPYKEN